VQDIEATDARTLVLRTDRALGSLPCRLASIPIAVAAEQKDAPLVGSGPYRIRRWPPDGDVVLEAFPSYRGGRPPLRELEFRVVPQVADRVAHLRGGQLDLIFDLPPSDLDGLDGVRGVRTLRTEGLRVLFLGLRCAPRLPSGENNPLRDVRVRRAIALAVDRASLVRGPLAGTAAVIDQVIAPGVVGHHEALPQTVFDRAGSRRLLAEAGISGLALELDYMPAKYRGMDAVVKSLVADLGTVGVQLTPRAWEPTAFFERIERRQSSLYLLGWMSTNGDAELTYEYLLHTPAKGLGVGNGGEYSDPVLDRLLEDASARLGAPERAEALRAVAERVQETLPVVPLYSQKELYALAAKLEFRPRLDRRIRGLDLGWKR
jgi:peptide/nickel transport system substrate-binding protein